MGKPNVMVLTGYGINCDEESKFAFEKAGAMAKIVHVNDLIDNPDRLDNYEILFFPGGFSHGDDTGSGKALARKIDTYLDEELEGFTRRDTLTIGVCNGFQVLTHLGLLPALDGASEKQVALVHNDSARYIDRWVDLKVNNASPWLKDMGEFSAPIAHGEGKFYADPETLKKIEQEGQVALRYFDGPICDYQGFEANPNGSLHNIAGITDKTGRILGMMPHPERAIEITHLPNWTYLKSEQGRENLPEEGPGMQLFRNAVEYFE